MESEEERNHVHIVHMCIILDIPDVDVTHSRVHTVHIPTQYKQSQDKAKLYSMYYSIHTYVYLRLSISCIQ